MIFMNGEGQRSIIVIKKKLLKKEKFFKCRKIYSNIFTLGWTSQSI